MVFWLSNGLDKFKSFTIVKSHGQKYLDVATNDLDLLSSSGRQTFVSECTHESLIVECIDTSVDLCSQAKLYIPSTINISGSLSLTLVFLVSGSMYDDW